MSKKRCTFGIVTWSDLQQVRRKHLEYKMRITQLQRQDHMYAETLY